jgi:putative alpha-1,2-mannosidase
MSRNSISFTGKAAHRWNNSLSRVRMNRINRQRQSRLENPLTHPLTYPSGVSIALHEEVLVALMRRVSHIFQTKHHCTKAFSDWKVTDMTVAELQFIDEEN